MKVSVNRIGENIYHLKFSKQQDLASTFVRFQEFFESPKFRNNIFSLKEFKKWYSGENENKFTYYEDYSGFNIPSRVLKKFYAGDFDPLSSKEKLLLDQFRDLRGRFYVIGTYDERRKKLAHDTLKHEIAHAMFYLDRDYREKVKAILSKTDTSGLRDAFKKRADYNKSVYQDECHAYMLCGLEWLEKTWGVDVRPLQKAHNELRRVFKKHHGA